MAGRRACATLSARSRCPSDDLPSSEGAAGGGSGGLRAARDLGLLLGAARRPGRAVLPTPSPVRNRRRRGGRREVTQAAPLAGLVVGVGLVVLLFGRPTSTV